MPNPADFNNQRSDLRFSSELPVKISIGSQLTLNGQLKDLSMKSAFIRIKYSIYLQMNDEVGFAIQCSPKEEDVITGLARISRISAGEGFAIYFTKMEKPSVSKLKEFLKVSEADV